MQYELSQLYGLINSNFSAALADPRQHVGHLAYLSERYGEWVKQYRITFRKTGSDYQVANAQAFSFQQVNGLPKPAPNQLLQNNALRDQLTEKAKKEWSLPGLALENVLLYEQEDQLLLQFAVTRSLTELSAGEAAFHYYQDLVSQEVERIQKDLPQAVFSQPTEEATRQYVRKHQYALFSLARLLWDKLPARNVNLIPAEAYGAAQLYTLCYEGVKKLYQFLEAHFRYYLSEEVPAWPLFSALGTDQERIVQLKHSLMESDLPSRLLRIVLLPLNQLVAAQTSSQPPLTLHRLSYLQRLLEELEVYRELNSGKREKQTLLELLKSLNFNHLSFFNYCTDQISEKLSELEGEERLLSLWRELKVYKQSPSVNHLIYSTHHPPLRDQIIHWLEEEIHYWERLQAQQQKTEQAVSQAEAELKIQTSLSVAELGYLTRALYDTEVFTNPQQKDILRVVTRSFSSLRQERISLQSLKAKYYDAEDSTRLRIKALAQRLLRYAEKPF